MLIYLGLDENLRKVKMTQGDSNTKILCRHHFTSISFVWIELLAFLKRRESTENQVRIRTQWLHGKGGNSYCKLSRITRNEREPSTQNRKML